MKNNNDFDVGYVFLALGCATTFSFLDGSVYGAWHIIPSMLMSYAAMNVSFYLRKKD